MISIRESTSTSATATIEPARWTMDLFSHHQPVLLKEAIDALAPHQGGRYIDCTVGEGGHALALLQGCLPGGYLLGIDPDPSAIAQARRRLQAYSASFTLIQDSYARLAEIVAYHNFSLADGIFFDLGLSSLQLGGGRGFSFQRDDPLDMRYDPTKGATAADIVNTYPFEGLTHLIKDYGEEPRARAIARAILQHRPLTSTAQLSALVARTVGFSRGRIHPATRTFQALRIAVNGELDNLEVGLNQAIRLVKPGGRLVVISYHSLEDRRVKTTFLRESRGCICPPQIPTCICGHVPTLRILSRRVITPSPEETAKNPRSRSARMRVAERLYESSS